MKRTFYLIVLGAAFLLACLLVSSQALANTAHDPAAPATIDCSGVTWIPLVECQAIVAVNNGLGIGQDGNNPCTWTGVTCSGGHITAFDYIDKSAYGTLSPEIGNLAYLESLSLSRLAFVNGSLPPELGQLANLRYLTIDSCPVTGSIPPELGNLAHLVGLTLRNTGLTGSIPPQLGNLPNLASLDLSQSAFSGTIPSVLGNLTALQVLKLYDAQLTGTIPSELGNLAQLHTLNLKCNRLSGSIPIELGALPVLKAFYLQRNQLSGAIPAQLCNLLDTVQWGWYDLNYNALTGGPNCLDGAVWVNTQTVPPTNLQALSQNGPSVRLSWTPIRYTGNGGYYEIASATDPDGPFTVRGTTVDKSASGYVANELAPGITHYFRVRTYTPPHWTQWADVEWQYNDLWSIPSSTVSATVPGPAISLLTQPSGSVASGGVIRYTIHYSNTVGLQATGVVITGPIPSLANLVAGSASSGAALVGNALIWDLGDVPDGTVGDLSYRVRLNTGLAAGTVITNSAALESDQLWPNATNVVTHTVALRPDLGLTTLCVTPSAPNPLLQPGDLLTYTVAYTNGGTLTAFGVTVTDTIPSGTEYVSGGAYNAGARMVTFSPGTVAVGASGAVSFTARVSSGMAPGVVLSNVAWVSSSQTSPWVTDPATITVTYPVLALSKAVAPPGDVYPLGASTYTLNFTNTGNTTATGVSLSDMLPPALDYVAGGALAGNVVTWNHGDLTAGASGVVTFTGRVKVSVAPDQIISNTASIAASNAASDISNSVSNSVIWPELLLSKAVAPVGVVLPGTPVTYTLYYTNPNGMALDGVVITDTWTQPTTGRSPTKAGRSARWRPARRAASVSRSSSATACLPVTSSATPRRSGLIWLIRCPATQRPTPLPGRIYN